MNAQVEKLMKSLQISEAEAMQVIEDDKRIDKGEKLFELSPELEAGAKKARQADRKPTVYNFDTSKRERKEDNDKRFLMNEIQQLLNATAENIEVVNPEREVTFSYKERKYKIVLSCPRK